MLLSLAAGVLVTALSTAVFAATDICYNPDGTQTTSTTHTPCFPSANVTHCCNEGTTCLKNGLCLNKSTFLNTGLCTDSTWQDEACFPRCLTPRRLGKPSTVYRCDDDKWCCSNGGGNSTSCCNDQGIELFKIIENAVVENGSAFLSGYSIAPIQNILTDSEPNPSTTLLQTYTFTTDVSGSQVTLTATATIDSNTIPVSSDDSDSALIAGLGAGLGVGLPLLAVIGLLSWLLFREKRRNRAQLAPHELHGHPFSDVPPASHYQTTPADPFQDGYSVPAAGQSPYSTGTTNDVISATLSAHRLEADSQEKKPARARPELPG
ncbi:uncharacterized protein Z518_02703 [Rhinocladiella mackenziei CBS 650.93]|uniref:Mid2 domain-containing protein n=1 Tax=Rhinocladiella mackenziei CBS 650.93 TaxID=1442369 RepID=A0A0D2HC91_9EURO|nr:uncharacterized protein Z518_02703 [Rhinocladiella mackenziei CBS 650.93]KIX08048.1 hypothetical protein Z518_02703 [Rhinocladiella mackenziei CBS 650.93]